MYMSIIPWYIVKYNDDVILTSHRRPYDTMTSLAINYIDVKLKCKTFSYVSNNFWGLIAEY